MNSNPPGAGARPLDHVVLPAASLGVARARLTALGFTVAPDGRHPFGTANCCVYLSDGTFLEPLAVDDAAEASASARAGNVFTARDAAYRRNVGNDGFSALVLASGDADADQSGFVKARLSAGNMLEFSRPFVDAAGASDTASFRLAFAADPRVDDIFLFTCQRLNAPKVDRSALQNHANGAARITQITIAANKPSDLVDLLTTGAGTAKADAGASRVAIDLPNAAIVAMTPAAIDAELGVAVGAAPSPRLVAIQFGVADLSAAEACFKSAGITYVRRKNRLVVPPAAGQGAVFAFEGSR
jgi:glyoxalase-like protein